MAFEAIKRWFGGRANENSQAMTPEELVDVHKRYWDASQRDEDNDRLWCKADGRHINAVLNDELEDVTRRATYEARANPLVEGVIETHKTDVVGRNGPSLQVQTDSDRWNQQAEEVWREEFAGHCDAAGQLAIGDYLKLGIESLWTTGTMLSQVVNDSYAETLLQTKLHPIATQRLRTPAERIGEPYFLLGVERTKAGRAKKYWVTDEEDQHLYGYYEGYKVRSVSAANMLCLYKIHEAGQVLGFPWLSSSLQVLEELREGDRAVLDAARLAAIYAVFASASGDMAPDPPPLPDDDNSTANNKTPYPKNIKTGAINYLPAQYTPNMLSPTQPDPNYVAFRSERHRELGRPVGMPLMQIRLDSSGHNYSSARFDGQIYARANESIQAWLERHILQRMAKTVFSEAMMTGLLPRRSLRGLRLQFNWDKPPHVDPVKEALAAQIRMNCKVTSPQKECAAHASDFEDVAREWARANEILEKNGLPPMLGPIPIDLAALQQFLQPQEESSQAA